MNKQHSNGFLDLVNMSKEVIKEVQAADMPGLLEQHPGLNIIDVREDSEYNAGHVKGAEHIGKGVIERDIEKLHPDRSEALYLYCGGGFRSALAAEALVKMGYEDVYSIDGGWGVLSQILPTE